MWRYWRTLRVCPTEMCPDLSPGQWRADLYTTHIKLSRLWIAAVSIHHLPITRHWWRVKINGPQDRSGNNPLPCSPLAGGDACRTERCLRTETSPWGLTPKLKCNNLRGPSTHHPPVTLAINATHSPTRCDPHKSFPDTGLTSFKPDHWAR